jgi:hypothetical protein
MADRETAGCADAGEVTGDVADEEVAEPLVDGESGEGFEVAAGPGKMVVGERADGGRGFGGVVGEDGEGFAAVTVGVSSGVGRVGMGEGFLRERGNGGSVSDGGEGAHFKGIGDGDVVDDGGDGALLVGDVGVPLGVRKGLGDGEEFLIRLFETSGESVGAIGHRKLLVSASGQVG